MSKDLLEAYVADWPRHAEVSDDARGQEHLQAFLSHLSHDIVYEDIPSGAVYRGRDDLAQFCRMVSDGFDLDVVVTSTQTDGSSFAFEFDCTMTARGSSTSTSFRGVAVGTIRNQKIASHRDYYDRSGFGATA